MALFQAGELKWGTDEEKFITMFGTRSVSHLRRVFDKYMTISGFQIEETIDRETSGNLEQLLLAVGSQVFVVLALISSLSRMNEKKNQQTIPGPSRHGKGDLLPTAMKEEERGHCASN